jgi:hypothetical protein
LIDHILHDHSMLKEASPPIEEAPFSGTDQDMIAYYQILLTEAKRHNKENIRNAEGGDADIVMQSGTKDIGGTDPLKIKMERKQLFGRCCKYALHPRQNKTFLELMENVKQNTFTKVYLEGINIYSGAEADN